MEKIELRIGYNNVAVNEICPICNNLFSPDIPIDLYMKYTMDVVCRQCGKEHAPELTFLLDNHYPDLEGDPDNELDQLWQN